MKETVLQDYTVEQANLLPHQIHSLLDQGMELAAKTDLIATLSDGGSALFPHTYISQCGAQIAAVAHASLEACQKTGKQQILLIGVLHSLTDTLKEARQREISSHSIPESLAGIEELKRVAKASIVIATSDLCHHGAAYGFTSDQAHPISQQGYDFAYRIIKENLRLLSDNDLLKYRQYCLDTLSDSLEVGQLLSYLLGPLEGIIRDMKLIDVSELFEDAPKPSWVAAALIELKSKHN